MVCEPKVAVFFFFFIKVHFILITLQVVFPMLDAQDCCGKLRTASLRGVFLGVLRVFPVRLGTFSPSDGRKTTMEGGKGG